MTYAALIYDLRRAHIWTTATDSKASTIVLTEETFQLRTHLAIEVIPIDTEVLVGLRGFDIVLATTLAPRLTERIELGDDLVKAFL